MFAGQLALTISGLFTGAAIYINFSSTIALSSSSGSWPIGAAT